MKTTLAAFCLAAFLATSGAAFADAPVAASARVSPTGSESRMAQIREKIMSRLKVTLELTEEQAQRLGAAMDTWHAQMKQRRDAFQQQFKTLLNPEQQAIVEKARQEREQRMAEWHAKREADKGSATRPGTVTATATAHRVHAVKSWQSLNLSTEQSKKMRALANQMRHLMKADREMMLAQASTILSPLQEKEFEATLTRLFASWTHARSERAKTERSKGEHHSSMDTSSADDEDEASVDPTQSTL